MTREVVVSISGLQFAKEACDEAVELMTSAEYYHKNNKHYILYEEVSEDFRESVKNTLKLSKDILEITKRGAVNVHMLFEKGKKNVTYYYTPYGTLLIGIDTTKMELCESENELEVWVEYVLELNDQFLANCTIHMKILSKNTGDFKI
ncbi:MAG: DUF1934 domain-containing protein [Clostridiales bacterium]|nr:DUF1934 domain-containing protein [Clostridiales bacterium]